MSDPRRKVRLFHLITELSSGGAQSTLLNLASDMDSERFETVVCCLFNGDGRVGDALRARGLRVVDLGMKQGSPLAALWRFYRLLRAERPDILHGWLFHANMVAKLVGRAARVPVIVTSRHSVQVGGPWRERLQAWTARLDDGVVVVSDAVRTAEIAHSGALPDKVTTIRNNVRVQDFADRYGSRRKRVRAALVGEDDPFLVGSVGRMHPVKGFDVLVEAFALFRTARPDSRLLLVGDGAIRGEIEAQVARLGLREQVTFLGDRNDVADLLAGFDLFVLASRWEGIPVVVLEAMAARVPVVATAVGGTPEVVEEGVTGLLAPAEDAAALAAAMVRLAGDEALRTRLVQAAFDSVEQDFSTARAADIYEELYLKLLRQKARKRASTS